VFSPLLIAFPEILDLVRGAAMSEPAWLWPATGQPAPLPASPAAQPGLVPLPGSVRPAAMAGPAPRPPRLDTLDLST